MLHWLYDAERWKNSCEVGLVSKKILKLFDIETGVSYAEMNGSLLVKEAVKNKVTFSEISKFPPVKRDLALLVDTSVQFAEIEKVAYDTERRLLKDVIPIRCL